MILSGQSLIAGQRGALNAETFFGINPATGESLEPAYRAASAEEVAEAARLAAAAFLSYRKASGRVRGGFLRKIAEEIEALGDALIHRTRQESALPEARIRGERARMCGQLRLFAGLVEEGSWADARVDLADPRRQPLARADIRSMLQGIGPVAVFGPSNFPLAFSVAGGDTAAALAAGCPVVVKAHPSHPGTSELVGGAIARAATACDLPGGVFSLLFGATPAVGRTLIQNAQIKAVAFTGSKRVGRELFDLAAGRPDPIPFFGELGSNNPVFLLPGAVRERPDAIAEGLYASVTLGVGQFCTNPGLVLIERGSDAERLIAALKQRMTTHAGGTMLNRRTREAFCEGVRRLGAHGGVATHATGRNEPGPGGAAAAAALFQSDVKTFLENPDLSEEIFGPATLVLTYDSPAELLAFVAALSGQLTASIQGNEADVRAQAELISLLELKVGRLILNGFPTGVEVCPAMVHGGPWPATTDSRFTSVGTGSIHRFARPVCYQDFPASALPLELQDGNPLGLWRTVNGERTRT